MAAFEVLLANSAVRNLIREGKAFQIPSVIQTNKQFGMQMMDDCIVDLVMKGLVSSETAMSYAHDSDAMSKRVNMIY